MNAWFSDRNPREQLLIAAGSGILLLVILWLLAWEPISQERDEYRARVAREQVILLELQQLASEARRLGAASGGATVRGDQSLLSLTDHTVRAAGLAGALRRIEPDGQQRVRLWLQQAQFDPLVSWLQSLARDHGIQVHTANFDLGDSVGVVVADITLEDAP